MKRILNFLAMALTMTAIACEPAGKASKWDGTKWSFDIEGSVMEVGTGYGSTTPFPGGMTLYINNAAEGDFVTDWTMLKTMELRNNGDLYFPIQETQHIEAGAGMSIDMTISGYCIISPDGENEAVGDIEVSMTVTAVDNGKEDFSETMKMQGYLKGKRVK